MKLDDITVRIRPRSPWEAMDLGLRIYQHYWKPVTVAWFALLLPLFILFNSIFFENPWIAALLIWWLKPLYDRLVLHILSRSLFGEIPDTRSTLRALPATLKNGLFLQLTLFRLDPSRSFRLPVMQLEGLKGRPRSQRMRVLHARGATPAFWLTITSVHIELALNLALYGLAYMFLPQNMGMGVFSPFFEDMPPWWADLLSNFLYLISMSLIEPFYVAAGFMLYLNRRTELEGWDIELIFRRMAQRLKTLASGGMAALLVIGIVSLPRQVLAEETIQPLPPLPVEESATVIQKVLADPDFGTSHMEEHWKLGDFDWNFDNDEADIDSPFELAGLAALMKIVIILTVIGVLIYLLYHYRDAIGMTARKGTDEPPPESVLGMDIRPESLPDDIPGEARRLWEAGEHRQAMSLLYCAMLSRLVNHYGVQIGEGDTEADILHCATTRLAGERLDYLDRLTTDWQLMAYAHRRPPAERFVALTDGWPRAFPDQEAPA